MFASRFSSLSSAKRREVARLLPERAHDADARQRLLQVGGDRADRLARARVRVRADAMRKTSDPANSTGKIRNVSSASSTSRNARITIVPRSVSVDWKSVDDACR